ncbi:hypothetical protein [Halochromatium glycolicum]|uniref:Uncharacterized protein n=1 Tax=Halochromatium glycolicum TaxID=85075 RepID=A0AAJ0X8H8_9GAMM|nr:hypothetical protein [Halochromatium glycolicum]MBK1703083.1 hypothetical protein [Halochromatium glycolicum]
MILVADCSALVALATCDALSLLDQLFGTVVGSAAVYREAVVGNKPEAERLRVYLQGRVRALDPEHPVLLDGFSDPGETEAMLCVPQA